MAFIKQNPDALPANTVAAQALFRLTNSQDGYRRALIGNLPVGPLVRPKQGKG